jgi:hypothetical protein
VASLGGVFLALRTNAAVGTLGALLLVLLVMVLLQGVGALVSWRLDR